MAIYAWMGAHLGMNAVEMFVRCRDHQAWKDDAAEARMIGEIGAAMRAAGMGGIRPAEVSESREATVPEEPMGNNAPTPPMEAMWA